ncbi:MAG: PAS domain-containing protein [Halodesulfurarchaeum sp.]|nr:PAS domain-containing protein [Halodesulfurarchaeum sp.]
MGSNSMPDSFLVHSGTEIVYANSTFCSFIDVDSPAELVGMSLLDIVDTDYHTPLREQISVIENGEASARGLTLKLDTAPDPTEVIAVSSMTTWEGSQHVQTSVFPLTDRYASPEQLLQGEEIDEAPIGITVSDPSQPHNPLIHVNDGFCKITGYDREEILGRNCRFLQGEATREEPVAQMRESIDAEEPVSVELRNYRKDGSMFWNRVTIIPVRDDSGTVTNYLGYQQDITAKKQQEQDLSLFKAHAEESEKAIVITDLDGTIQYVNPTFERLNEYTAAEAIGRNPRILKSGQQDDEFYAELWETITAGDVWDAEIVNKTKYGELYEAKQTITPVWDVDDEITHFVGIIEDVTENVLTRKALDVMNRVIRHNLRSAITVIDGHAALLEDGELDPNARRASVAAIRDQAASMQKIGEKTGKISSIRDLAKVREKWERPDMVSFFETYQRQYPGAEISCTVGDIGDIQIRNTALFKNAMDEAVSNAIQHTDQSPPKVSITVQRDRDGDQIQITIADNGPGMSEFERKAIQSAEQTPLGHSLGVGLWIMEWSAKTLGGELAITDNKPRGCVVTFWLPVGTSNDEKGSEE